jgi:hypothetical protein
MKIVEYEITNFSTSIRELVEKKKMEYIDAIVYWCEQNEKEVEYAASLIAKDANILFHIQQEAENLNFIKKTNRLSI